MATVSDRLEPWDDRFFLNVTFSIGTVKCEKSVIFPPLKSVCENGLDISYLDGFPLNTTVNISKKNNLYYLEGGGLMGMPANFEFVLVNFSNDDFMKLVSDLQKVYLKYKDDVSAPTGNKWKEKYDFEMEGLRQKVIEERRLNLEEASRKFTVICQEATEELKKATQRLQDAVNSSQP